MFLNPLTDNKSDKNLIFHTDDLIKIFNNCFKASHNTILVQGTDEPYYLPAGKACQHNQIIFAHGFFSSALHEIAHWLVAGPERWNLEDFGYWYCPDGRDEITQAKFESLEVAPQSYEWILSVAAGFSFQVSCDNLSGTFEPDHRAFRSRVHKKVMQRLASPLKERPAKLVYALQSFYHTPDLHPDLFILHNNHHEKYA